MADIALSALPQGTTLETNATIIVVQTVGSTVVNQRIPKALFFSQALASALVATNNLSDLIDAAAARLNIGVHNLIYLSGTAAPTTALGNLGDFAFNDNFEWYELTAITPAVVWTLRANGVTATELTTAIATHSSATDPHPIYLTQAEAAVLYAPLGESPGSGARYIFNTSTTFSGITTGQILFNNAASASVTSIAIHESDRNSGAMATVLDLIAVGSKLQISFDANEELYAWFNVTAIVDNGAYRTYTVTALASSGTPVNGEVVLGIYGAAATASTTGGATGVQFTYINTAGTPTNGQVRSADITAIGLSTVSISTTDAQTKSVADVLAKLKTGAIIEFAKDAANRVRGTISADYASGTNSFNWSGQVVYGAIANNSTVYLSIISDAPSASSGGASSGGTISASGTGDTITLSEIIPAATDWRPILYDWYRATVDNFELAQATLIAQNQLLTGYNDGGLATGTYYYIRVAKNQLGMPSASPIVSATAVSATFDTATLSAIAAVEATGVTLSGAQKTAANNRIVAAKASGAWAKLKGLYLWLGGTANAHAVNWKAPGTFNITWTGTLTHAANGITGTGAGYGLTGISPAAAEQDNYALGCYIQSLTVASSRAIGNRQFVSGNLANRYVQVSTSGQSFNSAINRFEVQHGSNASRTGSLLASRSNNATIEGYQNGAFVSSEASGDTQAANGGDTAVLGVWDNTANSISSQFSGRLCSAAFYSAGLSATEATAETAADLAMQTALGRN